jgi:hypothetical protein
MPETIEKLRPDRDLQCFYYDLSAIAALSETSPNGFTLSGGWRQQFDWAVVEWNRDNVFEHPAFRTLPDGDLSGLVLSYDEVRTNCIGVDSDLSPTVDWPYLRVWAGDNGAEQIYFVALKEHGTILEGAYNEAWAEFTISGTATTGAWVGLSQPNGPFPWLHFAYQIQAGQDLDWALEQIKVGMNTAPGSWVRAERTGLTLKVFYTGPKDPGSPEQGSNGNRFGMITFANGAAVWDVPGKTFANGTSPTKWRYEIDFSNLTGWKQDVNGAFLRDVNGKPIAFPIPTTKIRKMRWTYAAEQSVGPFVRQDFEVKVTNWTVTGTGRTYTVAGPKSRRIDDTDSQVIFDGAGWTKERGNYYGGIIRHTAVLGESVTIPYRASATHDLYVGTRYLHNGPMIAFEMDGTPAGTLNLHVPGEDVLIRWRVGTYAAGEHSLTITYAAHSLNAPHERFFFDFVELVVPTTELPVMPAMPRLTLATDWDTLHSVAIAPERSAWMLESMGFRGRQNHYVGALLFYELHNPGSAYAGGTVTFAGAPGANDEVAIEVGPPGGSVRVVRKVQPGETLETIALSFALEFNRGYNTLRAFAVGGVVTIVSRQLGPVGNTFILQASVTPPSGFSTFMTVSTSGSTLLGGLFGPGLYDGWKTDLEATPRLNRAMRDWTRSFMKTLDGYGIDAVCAFSTEIKHGDLTAAGGIAQLGVAGDPFYLPTPALQTNFSPTSLAFWRQVHADCAKLMEEAGVVPYLQFGEEQWWYFPHDGRLVNPVVFSSMPFYDPWTVAEFQNRYGHPMAVIAQNDVDPATVPDEAEFLGAILGEFTDAVIAYVKAFYPASRFEVLYPFDVNATAFNRLINLPDAWNPTTLDCFKTEGLGLTFTRRLRESEVGIDLGAELGFAPNARAHLVGLGDATAPWLKEMRIAEGEGLESVVGFALDQFCLIGFELPLQKSARRSVRIESD